MIDSHKIDDPLPKCHVCGGTKWYLVVGELRPGAWIARAEEHGRFACAACGKLATGRSRGVLGAIQDREFAIFIEKTKAMIDKLAEGVG